MRRRQTRASTESDLVRHHARGIFTKAGYPVPEVMVEFPVVDGPPDLDRIMNINDRIGLAILKLEGSAP